MCRCPAGVTGRAGQRDVDDVGGQLGLQLERLELRGARVDRGLQRLARLVGALPDRASLLRRQLADVTQQVGQFRFTAEEAHAHLFELGGCGGGGDRRLPLGAQCGDPVGGAHGRVILVSSYKATVAAMAAFSESAWAMGMWATPSQAARTSSGRPARSAPTTNVMSPGERVQRLALARDERDPPAGQLADRAHAGHGHVEQRAHRGPHGLVAVGVGAAGAERDARTRRRPARCGSPCPRSPGR